MRPSGLAVGLALAAVMAGGVARGAGELPPDLPIAAIMQQVVTPASNRVWELGAAWYEDDGSGSAPALADADWQAAAEASQALSAAAAALRTPGRPVAAPGATAADPAAELAPEQIAALIDSRRDAWDAEVQGMTEAMERIQAAIDARDLEALADTGNSLYDACESCHRAFWYPDQ